MYQTSVKLDLAELTYSCESFLKVVVTHHPQLCKGLTECKIRNLKWSAIFPILHEFDWSCVQSECTMLKFWLAILEKWSEIGQWPAVILHSVSGICCTVTLLLSMTEIGSQKCCNALPVLSGGYGEKVRVPYTQNTSRWFTYTIV